MGDAASAADADAAVEAVVEARMAETGVKVRGPSRGIRALNIRICPQESGPGAVIISSSGGPRTFVPNLQRVHGKMFSLQGHLNNDGPTSSVTQL